VIFKDIFLNGRHIFFQKIIQLLTNVYGVIRFIGLVVRDVFVFVFLLDKQILVVEVQ